MIATLILIAPAAVPGGESLHWNEVLTQYLQFAGYFLAVGGIGYRYLILSRLSEPATSSVSFGRERAAIAGLVGVLLLLLSALGAIELAAILHEKSFTESLPKALGRFEFRIVALLLGLVGYGLATRVSPRFGWLIAAVGVLAAALQTVVTSKLSGKVNAIHVLAVSTWLGTLTVMLFAALRALAREQDPGVPRQKIAADIVNAFSPVALTAAAVVAITGVTTAWLHLKRVSALWETSYGKALIVKLCLVGGVVFLGWWNWKRMRPTLNAATGEDSVIGIQRSATSEVLMAALVLVATAVLVSLPSPK